MNAPQPPSQAAETQVTEPVPAGEYPQKMLMSYEEYLAWAGEDTRAEWVNGEVIVEMPPLDQHQTLVEFLYQLINLFVTVSDLGRLRVAPFELKLILEGSSREPDLMFIAKEHLDQLTTERVVGPPDLIIEVISKDSVHRDRVDKFDEYEAGGVLEYWIIDNRPQQQRAWFYQLDEHSRYQSALIDSEGKYHSTALPGFWLRVDWLWQQQPNILRALAEVIGPEQVAQALQRAIDITDEDEKT